MLPRLTNRRDVEDIADFIGLTGSAVWSWTKGHSAALPKLFPKIAKYWRLPESVIFDAAGIPFPSLQEYDAAMEQRETDRRNHRQRERWNANPISQVKPDHLKSPRRLKWDKFHALPEGERDAARRLAASDTTRARQALADGRGSFSRADFYLLCKSWGYCCAYCNRRRSPDVVLTADHLVALASGGSNNIANITPACLSCNSSKQDKDVVEWSAVRGVILAARVLEQYEAQKATT